jgi:hypothetical protein
MKMVKLRIYVFEYSFFVLGIFCGQRAAGTRIVGDEFSYSYAEFRGLNQALISEQ